MSTDAELLHRYAKTQDERAFAELVQRHVGLVYSAALRRTNGRHALAEEITQKIFIDVARKAAPLTNHPSITGWLYRSTRYVAIDVIRSEQRREKLARVLTTMPEESSPVESVDWEQLRPVVDVVMDQLKEQDREIVLLRFFAGFTFAEVGAKLSLSENAARMRTERALEKLRQHLGRRGLTSTTAALGTLLANETLAAAPAGLSASIAAKALSFPHAAGGITTFLLMNKITIPAISAAIAAGVTVLVWTSVIPGVGAEEIAALRAENTRLAQATSPGATPAAVAAVADEYAVQVTAIAKAVGRRPDNGAIVSSGPSASTSQLPSAVTPRGHRNHGTATALDAAMTFAWAGDICDPEVFGKLIYFDSAARAKAEAVLATMPEAIRAQYPTPEAFYGLLLAASCTEAPPPGADILEKFQIVELNPGRVSHRPPGAKYDNWIFQQTPHGWKYVLPEAGVDGLPDILNSQTLAKLARR